jgi:hypothetical protein
MEDRLLRTERLYAKVSQEASEYCRSLSLKNELKYYKFTYYYDKVKALKHFKHVLTMRYSNY